MIKVYGIPNCDTVKKARVWLADHQIEYTFQDFKKIELTEETLMGWVKTFGLETVINKRGTTWRKLSEDDKALCANADTAAPIILNNLSMVKRPIVAVDDQAVLIGFTVDDWISYFQK